MKDRREINRNKRMKRVEFSTPAGGMGIVELSGSGLCYAVWGFDEMGWEHVSVSPKNGSIPSWDDMCETKDIFFHDEETCFQIHPKKSQYINLQENCLHLWKPKDKQLMAVFEEKLGLNAVMGGGEIK